MSDPNTTGDDRGPTGPGGAIARRGWRGDEHKLQLEAAGEVGLEQNEVEVEMYTQGFRSGMVLEDPTDRALVFRGRTVLRDAELKHALRPLLLYLGVSYDAVHVRVYDGKFELHVSARAADSSSAAIPEAKLALKLWFGFGLSGVAYLMWVPYIPQLGALMIWGIGLMLGGWQLRHGLASGRAMLGARMTLGLAMMAQEEQLILPPASDEGPVPALAGES